MSTVVEEAEGGDGFGGKLQALGNCQWVGKDTSQVTALQTVTRRVYHRDVSRRRRLRSHVPVGVIRRSWLRESDSAIPETRGAMHAFPTLQPRDISVVERFLSQMSSTAGVSWV